MKKVIKQVVKRFRAKTPKFFKTIRNISIAVALASGAAATTYATLDENIKATIPIEWVKYIGIAAITSTVISQLTKQDKTEA